MAYSHTSFSQTTSILDGGSTCAMNEINNLNGFMEYFPGITGIVISDLDAVVSIIWFNDVSIPILSLNSSRYLYMYLVFGFNSNNITCYIILFL